MADETEDTTTSTEDTTTKDENKVTAEDTTTSDEDMEEEDMAKHVHGEILDEHKESNVYQCIESGANDKMNMAAVAAETAGVRVTTKSFDREETHCNY